MSEARAMLEAALNECNLMPAVSLDAEGWPVMSDDDDRTMQLVSTKMLASTPSGAELIRRADRPEARVEVEGTDWEAVAQTLAVRFRMTDDEFNKVQDEFPAPRPPEPESRTEAVRRMQREGGGPVTAVMVSRADEAPRPPEPDRTAALVAALNLFGQHTDDCATWHQWGKVEPKCDCGLSAALAPTPDEAPPEPDRTAALIEKAMQDDMRRHPEAYGLPTPDDTP
jgi:hypothetical protein